MKGSCADCNGQSYTGQQRRAGCSHPSQRHIKKTPIAVEHYLREQIMRGMGCLDNIVTDTNSIKHNKVFNLYTAGT